MLIALMVVERDIKLVGKSVDDSSADAQTGERPWAREKSNFGDIAPIGGVFLEFVVNKTEDFFSHGGFELLLVGMIIEFEEALISGGVEIEFHRLSPVCV